MADENRKKPVTDEIATAQKDIDIFSGWLNRLENPDPVLLTESNGRGLKLYDEVARDAHAGSVLQTRYLAVAGREWEIVPADESSRAQEIADKVHEAVEGLNFTRSVAELLQAVLYGFYVVEVMWHEAGGLWVPAALVGKHPRRFSFTMDRELRLLTPANMLDGEALPDRKFVVFSWGSSDNPYGSGMGQKLWWPVWFKKNGIKFWLVFLEKFGMPTALGKYPPGTAPDQQQALLDALDAVHADTGIKIPNSMEIELLEAARTGSVSYESMCDYMDRQISKAVLGQTLTTEVKGEGSLAAGKVHNEVRGDIIKADADLLCETLNSTLIRWIVDYNFPGVTDYPALWIRTEAEQDLKALAERDKILLVDMGMAGRVPESYVSDTYGIPLADAGQPTIKAKSEPEKADADAKNAGKAPAFSAGSRFTPDQQAIEDGVDSILPVASAQRDRITADILAAVEQAQSWEDLTMLLAEMLDDEPAAEELAQTLSRAMVAAHMWGRYAKR
ncbi:MAG: DUF935 family protein [Desulfobacterales bacterium]|jgi:phage gp29-like protein|nr:DUF935 family protein [Desulfobacterales bacterium]